LVNEVGDADQDQNAVNDVRPDWHASERLFLMQHVDDARQEEHVDHRTEATTVSDDISDLQEYHHQPEFKKVYLVVKSGAEIAKGDDEKINHGNFRVARPFRAGEHDEILATDEIGKKRVDSKDSYEHEDVHHWHDPLSFVEVLGMRLEKPEFNF
jgi:hypothetical protein